MQIPLLRATADRRSLGASLAENRHCGLLRTDAPHHVGEPDVRSSGRDDIERSQLDHRRTWTALYKHCDVVRDVEAASTPSNRHTLNVAAASIGIDVLEHLCW